MKYKIVTTLGAGRASSPEKNLESMVDYHIADGWIPLGGIVQGASHFHLMQTMWKPPTVEPKPEVPTKPGACPKCNHSMANFDHALKDIKGNTHWVKLLYCPNCQYHVGAELEYPKVAPSTDDLYYELIMAVASVTPGESRHQTALRYILEREKYHEGPSQVEKPMENWIE